MSMRMDVMAERNQLVVVTDRPRSLTDDNSPRHNVRRSIADSKIVPKGTHNREYIGL